MDFEIILLLGLACAYVVECLLLEEKIGHEGPFKLKSTFILFPDTGHIQQASFFDIIRRMCGVYYWKAENNGFQTTWTVHPDRSERFTCPFCLSFWIALLFSTPYVLLNSLPPFTAWTSHFAIAYFAVLVIRVSNYVQMQGQ